MRCFRLSFLRDDAYHILLYNTGAQHSDPQLWTVTAHLKWLQNINYIPHVGQYSLVACRILVPSPEIEPWAQEQWVLTTGRPGNSQDSLDFWKGWKLSRDTNPHKKFYVKLKVKNCFHLGHVPTSTRKTSPVCSSDFPKTVCSTDIFKCLLYRHF